MGPSTNTTNVMLIITLIHISVHRRHNKFSGHRLPNFKEYFTLVGSYSFVIFP